MRVAVHGSDRDIIISGELESTERRNEWSARICTRQGDRQPRPADARRLISASRSQMTFDSVALRSTAPLLKLGKVVKPGHWFETSTIRPWSTPKPASRSAALNSAEVICGSFSKGRMVQCPHAGNRVAEVMRGLIA
jgi:hypothetical protein